MKLGMKLFVILLALNLFITCNPEDDMEEGLKYETQSGLDSGEEETLIDNKKNG